MHFDQDGTYNLVYIAEDECGNKTLAERVVEVATYRTVLYPDGTLIINEKGIDQASNESRHGGTATNVYAPFDPNGATDVAKYIFANATKRPWNSVRTSIKAVEVGSAIAPTSLAYWFQYMSNCENIDLTNVNTSNVTDMTSLFHGCSTVTSLDVTHFDTSNVTNMRAMFDACIALASLDVTHFNTSNVTNMIDMFYNCPALQNIDVGGFDTSNVTEMERMFSFCTALTSLDLSNFNTSNVTNMTAMFEGSSSLTTIYTSQDFVVAQVTRDGSMFANMSRVLKGGAGTVWSSTHIDKTYAHIDGGTSNPGYFTAKA